jgi:site-specific recombinase XerD
MGLLVRAARGARNRVLVQVAYAGGLRISELVGLIWSWSNVIRRNDGKVQLNVLGKGNKPRQELLPEVVRNALLKLRGEAGDDAPIFANPAGGPLTDHAVNYMLKAAAERAGLPGGFSAHWPRHAGNNPQSYHAGASFISASAARPFGPYGLPRDSAISKWW